MVTESRPKLKPEPRHLLPEPKSRLKYEMGIANAPIETYKPKPKPVGNRYKCKSETVVPMTDWSSNRCPHLRIEVKKTGVKGEVVQICQTCKAIRTLPGYYPELILAFTHKILKARTHRDESNYHCNQHDIQQRTKGKLTQ
jgi:hypothetical protein